MPTGWRSWRKAWSWKRDPRWRCSTGRSTLPRARCSPRATGEAGSLAGVLARHPRQPRFPFLQRARPVLLEQPGQRPIGEHAPAGLTRRAVVHLVFGVADPLNRRAAHRTRLAIPAVHRHLLAERRDSLGEAVPRRFAQAFDPGEQRVSGGVVESFDLLCGELGGQLRSEERRVGKEWRSEWWSCLGWTACTER